MFEDVICEQEDFFKTLAIFCKKLCKGRLHTCRIRKTHPEKAGHITSCSLTNHTAGSLFPFLSHPYPHTYYTYKNTIHMLTSTCSISLRHAFPHLQAMLAPCFPSDVQDPASQGRDEAGVSVTQPAGNLTVSSLELSLCS